MSEQRRTRSGGPIQEVSLEPVTRKSTKPEREKPAKKAEEPKEPELVNGFENLHETYWDGPPVKRKPNGDSYYLAFILNGIRYAIGECVWLWGGKDDNGKDKSVIARIDNVWEDGAGVMWAELMWCVFLAPAYHRSLVISSQMLSFCPEKSKKIRVHAGCICPKSFTAGSFQHTWKGKFSTATSAMRTRSPQ
jgi:hypothetical protein